MTFNVEFFNAQILKYKKQYIGFLMEEVALEENSNISQSQWGINIAGP